ncbi:YgaP family membrane protein [Salipiger mucosus]|uniref:Inner membrane protein YgaP-like transmembrane domain-containing protein n=1 Tax=Salipiger mucosus DSM 16094 TaxID=1123237 RepID=S9Q914_9RHOB|nr:DUF2892 domain-containing protein [Salipiger mucosus]EPX76078.1 hypothetical protein Salmuc_00731 [Salipiger mucosus DSM 16094]
MFQNNVGKLDRILRILVGALLVLAFFMVEGQWSWLYLIGIVPLVTGLLGSCPLYAMLGVSTCPRQ